MQNRSKEIQLKNELDIWVISSSVALGDPVRKSIFTLLSVPERERMQAFANEKLQQDFLLAHGFMRMALSKYNSAFKPQDWQFKVNEWGRPSLAFGGENLNFNLSHTNGLIVLAISNGCDVGVDVEALDAEIDLDLAMTVFSSEEYKAFQQVPLDQQRDRFFQLWTLKESYIKAMGKGLSIGLDSFSFDFAEEGQLTFKAPEMETTQHPWAFHLYDHEEFKISLCHQEEGVKKQIRYWMVDDIERGGLSYRPMTLNALFSYSAL